MLFRQLNNTNEDHTGSVSKLYFVTRREISLGIFLLTKEANGWTEDSQGHYTNFILEIIV